MGLEHEAKFSLDDRPAMEHLLQNAARLRAPWHFESNTVYDRDGELAASGRLLRLRQALTSTLTFKESAPGPETRGVKSRVEHETRIDDPLAMDLTLRGLGYAPRLRYEKFRCVWELPQGLVYLDILPFGDFLEIEALPDQIASIARGIGLDPACAMDKSYHDLHRSWREQNGLCACEDFVFDPARRRQLTILLGAQPQGDLNAD